MAAWPPRPAAASAAHGHFASGAGFAPRFAPKPALVPRPPSKPPLGTAASLVRVPKGSLPKGSVGEGKGGGKGHRITPYERRIGVKDEAPATPPDEPEDAGDPGGIQQLEDHVLEMHCHGVA